MKTKKKKPNPHLNNIRVDLLNMHAIACNGSQPLVFLTQGKKTHEFELDVAIDLFTRLAKHFRGYRKELKTLKLLPPAPVRPATRFEKLPSPFSME